MKDHKVQELSFSFSSVVKSSQNRIIWLISLIAVSLFVFYLVNPIGHVVAQGAIGEAIGHLARAESAQTPDEVIDHVVMVKDLLPLRGSISWWSGADFASIQDELDTVIARTENIISLEPDNGQWISEMYGIHDDIEAIEDKVIRESCSLFC